MDMELNSEELASLEQMLLQAQAGVAPTEQLEAKPEPEAPAAPTPEPEAPKQESSKAPKEEVAQPLDVAPEQEPRAVPYRRFKEVNQKATEAAQRAEQLQARADELQAKLEAFEKSQKAPEDDDWLSGILGHKDEPKADVPPEVKQLQARLDRLETEKREAEGVVLLERTLAQARIDYPDVPETILLQGLNAKASVEEIAQNWDYIVNLAVESKAKRQALTPTPDAGAARQNVAPRLTGKPGPLAAPPPPTHGKTWEQTGTMVQEWFRTQK